MGRPPLSEEARQLLAKARGILVDDQDTWLLGYTTWMIHHTGYVVSWLWLDGRQQMVYLHHCIVGHPIWEGDEVDHKDNDKLNNRRANISISTTYENKQNRDTVRHAKNVYQHSGTGTWYYKIHRNGEEFRSGQYKTEAEALAARDEWFKHSGG